MVTNGPETGDYWLQHSTSISLNHMWPSSANQPTHWWYVWRCSTTYHSHPWSLSHIIAPHIIVPHLIAYLISSRTSHHLTSPHCTWSHRNLSHRVPHLIVPHLIAYLISSRTSSHRVPHLVAYLITLNLTSQCLKVVLWNGDCLPILV